MKRAIASLLLLSLLALSLVGCKETVPTRTPDTDPAPLPDDDAAGGGDDTDTNLPDTNPDTSTPPIGDVAVNDPIHVPAVPDNAINVVSDWGVSTDAGAGIANGLILYEKIAALSSGAVIYFPHGTYEVDLPICLSGKRNIRIVGEDALLLNTRAANTAPAQSASEDERIPAALRPASATSGMVWIEGCDNITIEGLTFRYAAPTSLSGEVAAVTSSYMDVDITDGSSVTGNECVMAVGTFTSDGAPDRTLEQYSTFRVEKCSETTLRIWGNSFSSLSAGTRVCLRTSLDSNYVFTVFNSSDLVFRDLVLNNSFNGGFLIEPRTINVSFTRVHVKSHNEHALVSLNADAIHIAGLGGDLTVEDCHFERGGDDFINVHGVAATPTEITDTTVTYTLPWGADSRWATKGDVITFYHPTTFQLLGTATVSRVTGTALTFASLPDGVNSTTVLCNQTLLPRVTITDTTARFNRARAFLLQTRDITVRQCSFYGTSLAALLFAPDIVSWSELSPAAEVTICDNLFERCGDESVGAIQFSASHDDPARTYSADLHTDIRITHNTFSRLTVPMLYAVNCLRITFLDNTSEEVFSGQYLHLISCDTVLYNSVESYAVYAPGSTGVEEAE